MNKVRWRYKSIIRCGQHSISQLFAGHPGKSLRHQPHGAAHIGRCHAGAAVQHIAVGGGIERIDIAAGSRNSPKIGFAPKVTEITDPRWANGACSVRRGGDPGYIEGNHADPACEVRRITRHHALNTGSYHAVVASGKHNDLAVLLTELAECFDLTILARYDICGNVFERVKRWVKIRAPTVVDDANIRIRSKEAQQIRRNKIFVAPRRCPKCDRRNKVGVKSHTVHANTIAHGCHNARHMAAMRIICPVWHVCLTRGLIERQGHHYDFASQLRVVTAHGSVNHAQRDACPGISQSVCIGSMNKIQPCAVPVFIGFKTVSARCISLNRHI